MENIFCHIPKTGGTSIVEALGFSPGHRIVKLNKNNFVIAFVRNPYDRLISSFFYIKKGGINKYDLNDKNKFIGDSDLYEFVEKKLKLASEKQQHFIPQNKWIPNGASFIGRYENIYNDFNELKKLLNINKEIKHLNKTEHKNYKEYYNDHIADIVYKIYEEDFFKFGYDKNSYK